MANTQWVLEKTLWEKEFDSCPNPKCPTHTDPTIPHRLIDSMSEEVKKRGLCDAKREFSIQDWTCSITVPDIDAKMPLGAIMPAARIMVDVCAGCGLLRAVKIVRAEVEKTVQPPRLAVPILIPGNGHAQGR